MTIKKKKIIAIIPARGGSQGIKKKNLARLGKKPLLYYTVFSSLNCSKIDRTIVSTDNAEIEIYAKSLGVEVIKRPQRLANHFAKIEPTISHTLEFLKKKEKYFPDIIILLQNTSPLRTSKHIEESLKMFFENNYDSLLSGYISHQFFWKKNGKVVHPVNYSPLNRPNRQDMKNQFIENGSIYITKATSFSKSKCRISGKIGLYEMPKEQSIDIDTNLDLYLAEKIIKFTNENKTKQNQIKRKM